MASDFICIIFGLSLALIFPNISNAQYCDGFYKNCKPENKGKPYEYDGQSRSALFEKGQTSSFQMISHNGLDYKVSVCADENLGTIHLKIFETDTVEVTKTSTKTVQEDIMATCPVCDGTGKYEGDVCYNCGGTGKIPTGETKPVKETTKKTVKEKQKKVIYDNENNNYSTEVEFSMKNSKDLYIEITAGAKKETGEAEKSLIGGEIGCVGVLIQHMKSLKKGF